MIASLGPYLVETGIADPSGELHHSRGQSRTQQQINKNLVAVSAEDMTSSQEKGPDGILHCMAMP